jgi:hypothetical protein
MDNSLFNENPKRPTKLDLFTAEKAAEDTKKSKLDQNASKRKQINSIDLLTAIQSFLPLDIQREITAYVASNFTISDHLAFQTVHNLPQNTLITKETLGTDPTQAISIHKNVAYIGCKNGNIILFDLSKKKVIDRIDAHQQSVTALMADASILISGSADGTIKIWDIRTLQPLKTLTAHNTSIQALALNNEYIISRSGDELYVWDKNTYQTLQTRINLHNGQIEGLMIIGKYIVEYEQHTQRSPEIRSYELSNISNLCSLSANKIFAASSQGVIGIFHTNISRKVDILHPPFQIEALTKHDIDVPNALHIGILSAQLMSYGISGSIVTSSINVCLQRLVGMNPTLSKGIIHSSNPYVPVILSAILYVCINHSDMLINSIQSYIDSVSFAVLPCLNYTDLPLLATRINNAKYLMLWNPKNNGNIYFRLNNEVNKVIAFESQVVLVKDNGFEILDFSTFTHTQQFFKKDSLSIAEWETLHKINTAYETNTVATLTQVEAQAITSILKRLSGVLDTDQLHSVEKEIKNYYR